MIADLHTHTTASDGKLNPAELILRAQKFQLEVLSITDHDTVAAYVSVPQLNPGDLRIIPGIEFSTCWRKIDIHVLGLNIKLDYGALSEGISRQADLRWERAEKIAGKLEKYGFDNALEGAVQIAKNRNIGRPHFAEYMVRMKFVKDVNQAFAKYLAPGKPCYFRQDWSALPEVIGWINSAGGTAVLAHPGKYNLTRTKLLELLEDFRICGGEGMEVIAGRQIPSLTRYLSSICVTMKLRASCGSDFHQPGQSWSEIGQFPALPASCIPVWENW